LHEVHGVLLVFDITNANSIQAIDQWRSIMPSKFNTMVLCAHKSDKANHIIKPSSLDAYIRDCGYLGWHMTSAKHDSTIREAFDFLIDNVLKKMLKKYQGLPLDRARLVSVGKSAAPTAHLLNQYNSQFATAASSSSSATQQQHKSRTTSALLLADPNSQQQQRGHSPSGSFADSDSVISRGGSDNFSYSFVPVGERMEQLQQKTSTATSASSQQSGSKNYDDQAGDSPLAILNEQVTGIDAFKREVIDFFKQVSDRFNEYSSITQRYKLLSPMRVQLLNSIRDEVR